MRIESFLPLVGERDYLQGSVLLSHLLDCIKSIEPCEPTEIDFSCRRFTHKNILIEFGKEEAASSEESKIIAECRYSIGGRMQLSTIREGEHDITNRVDDACKGSIKDIVVDNENRFAQVSTKSDVCELSLWVTVLKHLHDVVYPLKDDKWIFTRAHLSRYSYAQSKTLSAKICASIGSKFTRSQIFRDGQLIGDIYFCRI